MNKLSEFIDRLQKLASTASPEHRSQLSIQAIALRARLNTQREHCIELLQLSEGNADRYLLDIDTEIQQQSEFLDKLEGRLEAAKKLRGEAAELQRLYESGTAATMRNLRATALSRPLPQDRTLFRELDDLVLTEIGRCYVELDKFWTEEISRTVETLNTRRIHPSDFERWTNTRTNLKQTIEFWKNELPSSNGQSLHHDRACSSEEADIWVIASSLSSTMGSLTLALERLLSSYSLKCLPSCQSFIQRVYVAFAANSDLCLSFLQRCVDYGEKVIGCRLPSVPLCTPFRVMASDDRWERTVRLQSEMTGISAENAASAQGSRKFKAAYKKALRLEEKANSGLNTLLEKLSSCVMVIDADDTPPDVVTLEQLEERWEKAKDSVRAALAILKNEPVPQPVYCPAPTAINTLRSVTRRWTINLVCFS